MLRKKWLVPPQKLFLSQLGTTLDDIKKIIQEQHGLPCDGGGVPGEWCVVKSIMGCYWVRKIKLVAKLGGEGGAQYISIEPR